LRLLLGASVRREEKLSKIDEKITLIPHTGGLFLSQARDDDVFTLLSERRRGAETPLRASPLRLRPLATYTSYSHQDSANGCDM